MLPVFDVSALFMLPEHVLLVYSQTILSHSIRVILPFQHLFTPGYIILGWIAEALPTLIAYIDLANMIAMGYLETRPSNHSIAPELPGQCDGWNVSFWFDAADEFGNSE